MGPFSSLLLGVLIGVAIGHLAAFLVICCCRLAGLADAHIPRPVVQESEEEEP